MICTDLIKLIKACRTNGVSNIKMGDIELSFNQELPQEKIHTPYVDPVDLIDYNDKDDEDEDEDDSGIPLDQMMDELKFTDPEAWDDLAKSGDI